MSLKVGEMVFLSQKMRLNSGSMDKNKESLKIIPEVHFDNPIWLSSRLQEFVLGIVLPMRHLSSPAQARVCLASFAPSGVGGLSRSSSVLVPS